LGQVFYLFNTRFLTESSCRPSQFFTNKVIWVALALLSILQALFVYAPFMQRWFGTEALLFEHWWIPMLIAAGIFLVVEVEKWVYRTVQERTGTK
jgi:magnesium-transporting ATPase (P-type)